MKRVASSRKYRPVRFPGENRRSKKTKGLPKSFLTGKYRRNDYKQVWYQGRSQGAHVVAWKKKYGDNSIPKGHVVNHKRGNKMNPNPSVRDLEVMPHGAHAKMSATQRYNPKTDSHYE